MSWKHRVMKGINSTFSNIYTMRNEWPSRCQAIIQKEIDLLSEFILEYFSIVFAWWFRCCENVKSIRVWVKYSFNFLFSSSNEELLLNLLKKSIILDEIIDHVMNENVEYNNDDDSDALKHNRSKDNLLRLFFYFLYFQ